MKPRLPAVGWRGLAAAALVLSAWASLLATLLLAPLHGPGAWLWAPLGVVVLTWLYTGLFITAHDAMHGTLAPDHPRLGHALGTLCLGLYAGLDYRRLRAAHVQHHARPGRPGDPDWHDGQHPGLVRWFLAFMGRYLTLGQVLRLVIVFNLLLHVAELPLPNLLLFWALPSIASTVQLFVVGTWLPHRAPPGGHTSPHNARSVALPPWLSLLACYHFGYHEEHHVFPGVPWWQLPRVRRGFRQGG